MCVRKAHWKSTHSLLTCVDPLHTPDSRLWKAVGAEGKGRRELELRACMIGCISVNVVSGKWQLVELLVLELLGLFRRRSRMLFLLVASPHSRSLFSFRP